MSGTASPKTSPVITFTETRTPNSAYDPTPCCEKWSQDGDTYYCPAHMTYRVGKEWVWIETE